MSDSSPLPRWDLTAIFPAPDSPAFADAFARATESIAALKALFDRLGIAGREGEAPLTESDVAAYDEATAALDAVLEPIGTLRSYLGCLTATDSRDPGPQARMSELMREMVALTALTQCYTAWLGALDAEALIGRSSRAAAHAFAVRRARVAAAHLMSPAEESLATELSLSGSVAWTRLYQNISSQTLVPVGEETLPMSVVRALSSDSDRETRHQAYEAELCTWQKAAVPLAAAMNSIKHDTNVLTRRRGWADPLDAVVFGNSIDRATLEAMLTAARDAFPDFRRYLRAKAKHLSGEARLPWFDLFAPVGDEGGGWAWPEAEAFVAAQFDTFSPKLGDFARRAYRERWIDAEPRADKRDGAFCTAIRRDESRILHNYRPSLDGVQTLAHELGHAYHNVCLSGRTPQQRATPMTLAETASIFCETIVRDAALGAAKSDAERLAIVEGALQGACQVVVDITSRFLFEQRVLEQRRARELAIDELCALMVDAQRETYGDGLDERFLHPYMWAAKPHYYGPTFYNFPYMFGLLFGLGLYAQYQQEPDSFRTRYDELLSRTGMDDAAGLAAGFGIDLRDLSFWTASLDIVRADIDRFETLAG